MDDVKTQSAIDALNRIMELELAGVVKYTHYSLMVYGYNRIPIVSWLKGNAEEGLAHAHKAGELVTLMGGPFAEDWHGAAPATVIGERFATPCHWMRPGRPVKRDEPRARRPAATCLSLSLCVFRSGCP